MQAHWRFPFNLVLVTILWFFDPQAVNSLTTATELFTKTHELCIKRLLQRLSDHEETRTVEGFELRDKVKKVMKKLCKEAFLSHCDNAVVLSRPSVERLKGACRPPRLPANEVLGAFLVLATSLTGDEEKYSFPHKSMQDFLAAMHVKEIIMADEVGLNIPEIIDGFENVLSHQEVPQNISNSLINEINLVLLKCQREASRQLPSIQSVLEGATKEAALYIGQETKLDLVKYQNILIHLTGLLHLGGKTLAEERATELVELLKATGIRDTPQWLDLLSEVKCDNTITALISKKIDLTGCIFIRDEHLAAFLRVLSHARPSPLVLDISGDPEDIPSLSELLRAMKGKTWEVWLWLQHDFRNPRAGGSVLEEALQQVFRSGCLQVTRFKGQLSGSATAALPSSLVHLLLAVKDEDHARALLPALSSLPTRLPRLGFLDLHVAAGLDAASLRPLPDVRDSALWVSGVEEATVEGASRVVAALQPPNGYWRLHFPGALTYESSLLHLLANLRRKGVRVKGGVTASPSIGGGTEERVKDLVRRELGCDFEMLDEEYIWRFDGGIFWSYV